MAAEFLLVRSQTVPRPVEEVFSFYAEPRNLARITPRWLGFRVLNEGELEMREGLHAATVELAHHAVGAAAPVRRQLNAIFDFRARIVAEVFGG
jgi:ligand-binding SRPBCC domain-containing protein